MKDIIINVNRDKFIKNLQLVTETNDTYVNIYVSTTTMIIETYNYEDETLHNINMLCDAIDIEDRRVFRVKPLELLKELRTHVDVIINLNNLETWKNSK